MSISQKRYTGRKKRKQPVYLPMHVGNSSKNTIEKILLSGIGSFILVMFFPRGIKFFFRTLFADLVSSIVTIVLAGLLTQKVAEAIKRKDPKRNTLNPHATDSE